MPCSQLRFELLAGEMVQRKWVLALRGQKGINRQIKHSKFLLHQLLHYKGQFLCLEMDAIFGDLFPLPVRLLLQEEKLVSLMCDVCKWVKQTESQNPT